MIALSLWGPAAPGVPEAWADGAVLEAPVSSLSEPMPHPEPDTMPSLPRVAWRLGMAEPSGFDGAGVHALAEVTGQGFTADGMVHMLDEVGLAVPLTLEALRRSAGFHEWMRVEGVIPVRAIELEAGRVAVLSEAFGGQPLTRVIGAVPVPPRAAGELVAQLSQILHELHIVASPGAIKSAGLAHGGVDLDHVMVGRKGHVALLEAGVVAPLRERGVAAVDPGFLAPEVRDVAASTPAADVYGATLVLLTCLTGRPPDAFPPDPEAHAEAVEAVLAGVFELDGQIAELLRLGLSVDPTMRPSARELSSRLRADLPRLGGRWFSAWAGDSLARHPDYRPIPWGERVREATTAPQKMAEGTHGGGGLRPLQKVGDGGWSLDPRRMLVTGAGVLGSFALLFLAFMVGVEPVTRWWLDNHGPMETEDVPTELQGPPRGDASSASPQTAGEPAAGPASAAVGVASVASAPAAPEPEPGGFALATANEAPVPQAPPPVKLETAPPPPPPPPTPVLPLPIVTEEPFGQDWEVVGPDKPILELEIEMPMADDLRVLCANGVTAHGVDRVSVQPRRGRCDVRAMGLSGVAKGHFTPENSGRVTCRVEFADVLRCRGE